MISLDFFFRGFRVYWINSRCSISNGLFHCHHPFGCRHCIGHSPNSLCRGKKQYRITIIIYHHQSEQKQICNATIIGLVCGLSVISGTFHRLHLSENIIAGLSSIIELSGHPAPYDYLKFLSIPGTIQLTNWTSLALTLFLLAITGVGSWLNYIRYKQFGLARQGAAAESLIAS